METTSPHPTEASEELEPEIPNPIDESAALEEEELGYPLNAMSNLYYEFPSEEGEEEIVDPDPSPEVDSTKANLDEEPTLSV